MHQSFGTLGLILMRGAPGRQAPLWPRTGHSTPGVERQVQSSPLCHGSPPCTASMQLFSCGVDKSMGMRLSENLRILLYEMHMLAKCFLMRFNLSNLNII